MILYNNILLIIKMHSMQCVVLSIFFDNTIVIELNRGQTIKINTLKERCSTFSIDEFGFVVES